MHKWTTTKLVGSFSAACLGVGVLGAVGAPNPTVTAASPVPAVEISVGPQRLGRISPDLFGANLLWPYDAEGSFDAATNAFYPEFVTALRRVGITALRYPGGTTADNFQWQRAIGPQSLRQPNEPFGTQTAGPNPSAYGPTPSTVGPDEFGRLLGQTGAIGNVVVNFVTGTPEEAADFVAYMTAPQSRHPSSNPSEPSYWAGLRAKNGHPAPYDVPYWEIGNEQILTSQYGWRSGTVVSIGAHSTSCSDVATCLYAFGGTTSFTSQPVGTFADEQPVASYSTGAPDQSFYVYYPPVVVHSQTVEVAGQTWTQVADLSTAGPGEDVYAFDPITGRITFGDGTHGAIPARGAEITVSYQSGPHGGFVQFYRAMKRMNPRIKICETEETNVAFLQDMGQTYPYDCVEKHQYVGPLTGSPTQAYEEALMGNPTFEGATVTSLQQAIRKYSGRNIPVVITEYGQLPSAPDSSFNLSLDEGLLMAAQLREWIDHNVPLAEKYVLTSEALSNVEPPLLNVDSAMIAGPGPSFVLEPTGEVQNLMSRLAGSQRLDSAVRNGPMMKPYGQQIPVLRVIAAAAPGGQVDLLVINDSPATSVTTQLVLPGVRHASQITASVLDGPSPTSYNTASAPGTVETTTTTADVGHGDFAWTFPAHSVTLLQLPRRR